MASVLYLLITLKIFVMIPIVATVHTKYTIYWFLGTSPKVISDHHLEPTKPVKMIRLLINDMPSSTGLMAPKLRKSK